MILIVDDDARMAETLRTVLEHEGESVRMASNGVEAYGILKSGQCSLMLLDINMPELSGTELLAMMKDENIRTPTIVMTGNEDFAAEALKAYPFVVGLERKPFDIVKVAAIIHGYVGKEVRVCAVTATRQIEGNLALPSAEHLPAFLEKAGTFIALTHAAVTNLDGSKALESPEVNLRVDSIVCVSASDVVPAGTGAHHGAD